MPINLKSKIICGHPINKPSLIPLQHSNLLKIFNVIRTIEILEVISFLLLPYFLKLNSSIF